MTWRRWGEYRHLRLKNIASQKRGSAGVDTASFFVAFEIIRKFYVQIIFKSSSKFL